ncbi:MAG: glycosyltransferase family 9 protein, partial [Planctomycetes bacterium]|nr:glycosyltransferase family 9 protein [Planctomycetota bacterium]
MRKLILRQYQSPGDILMLTAAVRDLHRAYPGRFLTDVRTTAPEIWEHNPHITPLDEADPDVTVLDMHYPLIHQSNRAPYHFIHGFVQYLESVLGLKIPVTEFKGDVHLSEEEKRWMSQVEELGHRGEFWIIVAGGKYDFTAKWWDPARYQKVVDHFQGRIQFVQCGADGDWHPPLKNVIDLVGKTDIRQFIRLMYHASGVVCPVTFAMHLASAVETKPGTRRDRPCVVIAGGREPPHWEAYPHHQFLSTNGALRCCEGGGCWRARCQRVGDRHPKDYFDLCVDPVPVSPDLCIPRCMDMITADDVIRRIELYCQERTPRRGRMRMLREMETSQVRTDSATPVPEQSQETPCKQRVLLGFLHGLGDAVQFTIVLQHLRQARPDWKIDVVCRAGTHTALAWLCHQVFPVRLAPDRKVDFCGGPEPKPEDYEWTFELDWPESPIAYRDWPSTKVTYTLKEVFHIEPQPELFHYRIPLGDEARERTAAYLSDICGTGPAPSGRY